VNECPTSQARAARLGSGETKKRKGYFQLEKSSEEFPGHWRRGGTKGAEDQPDVKKTATLQTIKATHVESGEKERETGIRKVAMVVAELTKDQKVLLTSALQLIKESETGVKSSVVEKLEKELKTKNCVLDSSEVSLGDLLTVRPEEASARSPTFRAPC